MGKERWTKSIGGQGKEGNLREEILNLILQEELELGGEREGYPERRQHPSRLISKLNVGS